MFWLQENLILMKEMGNCPEFHSWRSNFLQNLHFSAMENLDLVTYIILPNNYKKIYSHFGFIAKFKG